jgi:hypothetical protein
MTPRTRVRERAEDQAHFMNEEQQAAIRAMANDLHRLNQSVMKAVEAGIQSNSSARPGTTAATATGETC